jgi:hypothetical protein
MAWGLVDPRHMDTAITVNGRIPNLFRGLLAYRPRADRNSHENFLTEAFAYTLAQDPSFASRIIKKLVGRKFALKRITNIRTQVSLGDENSRGLPDMMIEVLERNGKALQIWIENKWSASANPDQISRYIGYLKAHDSKVRKRLALLTPRHTDAMFCSGAVRGIAISHITWSTIHELLASHRVSGIAKEFEHFLGEKDLVVKPIRLAATLTTAANGGRRDLRENLWTLCTRVQQGLSATVLTKDVTCHDGYGRVALWMFKAGCRLVCSTIRPIMRPGFSMKSVRWTSSCASKGRTRRRIPSPRERN